MKKIAIALVLIFAATLTVGLKASAGTSEILGRKIVVFKTGVNDDAKGKLAARFKGAKIKDLRSVNGQALEISAKGALDLAKQPEVLRVDDDVIVTALGKPGDVTALAQTLPWGVAKINADDVWSQTTADPIKVGIIDTGISTSHPDLKANIKGGINTILARKGYNDDNGHGSHVAGIVAAVNNTAGVVGVAPKADLYAIKVLNAAGSGYLSDIIEGLDWAVKNKMQVVNMSLGTTSNVQSFHDAVAATKAAGVVIVAAAGNSGPNDNTVNYPGAYDEVISVSATDSNNNIASFSSRGPQVDLAAPGVSIYSTYKGTAYATLSGTSMASPHAAGVAALVLSVPVGGNDANANGKWDPAEVQAKLEETAVDLGDAGKDNLFGRGLVDAYAATR
ncbi:MAG: S8 family peptidase [Candidatus Pacebacteria bacterium]|jgi:subtilisin family serine protease|nr:S8 family peptidase [Candidatus Paceibacterota bacterium]